MTQIAVFPKARKVPVDRVPVPERREIDVRVGDKVRVRVYDKKKPAGKSDEYVEAGPPERIGVVVYVGDRWVTVDLGAYRICAWKTDIAAIYRDGAVVVQPDAESWGKKRKNAE